jgi:hypothetical protein
MQQPYMPYNGYLTSYNGFGTGQYGTGQYGGSGWELDYSQDFQPYSGQSYISPINEWLPLPGYNRRRSLRSVMIPKLDNNLALPKRK